MRIELLELRKQKKRVWLLCLCFPILVNIMLCISLISRYNTYLLPKQAEYGLSCWQLVFKEQTILYFSEICHIMIAALIFETFSFEMKQNAWIHISSSTYKNKVINAKFFVVAVDILLLFICNYIMLYFAGILGGVKAPFEAGLFAKGFIIQIFSSFIYASFYMFVVSFSKKVSLVIPCSFAFMLLNMILYYGKGFHYRFSIFLPSVYISHNSLSTWSQAILIVVISSVLTVALLYLSNRNLKRNCDLRL